MAACKLESGNERCQVLATRSVLLGTTAISLIVSGYLWLELRAERSAARSSHSDQLLTSDLGGSSPPAPSSLSIPDESQSTTPVLTPDERAETTASNVASSASYTHEYLIALEFSRPWYSLGDARTMLARSYPELRQGAGLSDEEVETLAKLIARGAYPEESERALGTSTYHRWMEYRRTVDADRMVESLQKRLPDDPLNESQARALALVFQDEQRRHDEQSPRAPMAAPDARSKLESELRAARLDASRRANVIAQARAFLTEKQIAALQNDSVAKLRAAHLAALELELGDGGR